MYHVSLIYVIKETYIFHINLALLGPLDHTAHVAGMIQSDSLQSDPVPEAESSLSLDPTENL